jgi:hypothetical protein
MGLFEPGSTIKKYPVQEWAGVKPKPTAYEKNVCLQITLRSFIEPGCWQELL